MKKITTSNIFLGKILNKLFNLWTKRLIYRFILHTFGSIAITVQATAKSAAIFMLLDHIRVAADNRLHLNNKEMQAWTQSVSVLRAIDVVNFRFGFFLYPRQYYRFLSCCRCRPDCVRGEGRGARAAFISVLTVEQPHAFSALSRARACIFAISNAWPCLQKMQFT